LFFKEIVMPLGIIGKKVGMTQIFDENGNVIPVTVIDCPPSVVTQIKTLENDGYQSIQLGFDDKFKNVKAPLKGKFNKIDVFPKRVLKEFRMDEATSLEDYKIGDNIGLEQIEAGDYIDVVGTSKGKGFQGVVKRYGFHGGRATHGSRMHRATGSIGQHQDPGRVFKGKKLPGQMGNVRKTIQNLKVIEKLPEENLLIVKGSIPGPNKGAVLIKKSVKKSAVTK
jgi:large subunit ribosomal protein L3